jgi:site-specific recombinase XerC
LNREDVDLANGEFIVLGKGNKERTVFLDDVAIMTLKEYLLSRNDNCNALFVYRYGKRLQPGGVRAMLKKVSEK